MKKINKICLVIIILCVIGIIGVISFVILNHDTSKDTDAYKFKSQYEAYNGLEDASGNEYLELEINENNKIVYKTGAEIVDLLNSGTGIIYFGYPSSNLARNIISSLFFALDYTNIDEIYYLDIYNIRDEYIYDNSIIPTQTKEGSTSYYEIVDILDEYLSEYYVVDSSTGYLFDTSVKRLYAPTVVVVKDGKIVAFHEGTLDGLTDTDNLDDEQMEELQQIYIEMFTQLDQSDTCSIDDGAC